MSTAAMPPFRVIAGAALVLGAILSGTACSDASSGRGDEDAPAGGADPVLAPPAEAFADMEKLLLEAPDARVAFRVTVAGAVEADLSGLLVLGGPGRARLEATGTFAGDSVDALLVSDGRRMRLSSAGETVESATPPSLSEALVLGLSRMGILHNLARLVAGQAPDHGEGGVSEWVRATDFARDGKAITFSIEVGGTRSGGAKLFLVPGSGVPSERRQSVSFSEGDMEVVEHYGAVSVRGGVADSVFVIPEG